MDSQGGWTSLWIVKMAGQVYGQLSWTSLWLVKLAGLVYSVQFSSFIYHPRNIINRIQ